MIDLFSVSLLAFWSIINICIICILFQECDTHMASGTTFSLENTDGDISTCILRVAVEIIRILKCWLIIYQVRK